jgi:hypothetical protein
MFSDHAPYSTLAHSQRENQFFWQKNEAGLIFGFLFAFSGNTWNGGV